MAASPEERVGVLTRAAATSLRCRRPTPPSLVRQQPLKTLHAPDYVPDYVIVQGEEDGAPTAKKVYVTEVNGIWTLDLFSGWNPDMQEGMRIRQLPAKVCSLLQLERLWASHNLLSTLPANVSLLSNLTELLLHQNQFSEFPKVVCQLHNLRLLWLSFNQIPSVPHEISQLKCLRRLHLEHNLISDLPDSLCELDKLEVLSVSHNRLKSVCDGMGELHCLRRLFLQHNQISHLPHSFCKLTNIERLNLDHNNIEHLPTEFHCFQTKANSDGARRISTEDNPFESPRPLLKSDSITVGDDPMYRPRTMSFPVVKRPNLRSSQTRTPAFSMSFPEEQSYMNINPNSLQSLPVSSRRTSSTLPHT